MKHITLSLLNIAMPVQLLLMHIFSTFFMLSCFQHSPCTAAFWPLIICYKSTVGIKASELKSDCQMYNRLTNWASEIDCKRFTINNTKIDNAAMSLFVLLYFAALI